MAALSDLDKLWHRGRAITDDMKLFMLGVLRRTWMGTERTRLLRLGQAISSAAAGDPFYPEDLSIARGLSTFEVQPSPPRRPRLFWVHVTTCEIPDVWLARALDCGVISQSEPGAGVDHAVEMISQALLICLQDDHRAIAEWAAQQGVKVPGLVDWARSPEGFQRESDEPADWAAMWSATDGYIVVLELMDDCTLRQRVRIPASTLTS